jgi:DNA polymerase lambda
VFIGGIIFSSAQLKILMELAAPSGEDPKLLLSRNKELADKLALIGHYYQLINDDIRSKTYLNAGLQIARYSQVIISGEQAKQIPGIVISIAKDIDEFLVTGTMSRLIKLEDQLAEIIPVIDYFLSFFGIGPKTAVRFYQEGYRSIEDAWSELTSAQQLGVTWNDQISLPIPRVEMDEINLVIQDLFRDYGLHWMMAGSYRRGEATSGDLDLLIESRPDFNLGGLLEVLDPLLMGVLAQGKKVAMTIMRLDEDHNAHRMDIKLIPPESFIFAVLHYTGSWRFNLLLRSRAKKLGYTLNEYGLENNQGQKMLITSEAEIFERLGVLYVLPQDRKKTITELPLI